MSPREPKQALADAQQAFAKYYAQCFWSFDPNYVVTLDDVAWVAEQLKKHGNREAWLVAAALETSA